MSLVLDLDVLAMKVHPGGRHMLKVIFILKQMVQLFHIYYQINWLNYYIKSIYTQEEIKLCTPHIFFVQKALNQTRLPDTIITNNYIFENIIKIFVKASSSIGPG